MSWFSSLLGGGGKNPADAAQGYLNQIPGAMNPYFQPYISGGQQAGSSLTGEYNQMTQHPGELYARLGEGYKESPGYRFKLQQAMQGAENAAASGGYLGSGQDEQTRMQLANDIGGQDFNNYLQNILGLYGQGIQGQQGLQEQGFKASTGYGENLGNVLGTQAQYAYGGQAGENANRSQNWSNLFNALGTIGGGIAGGPIGSAAANYFFPGQKK